MFIKNRIFPLMSFMSAVTFAFLLLISLPANAGVGQCVVGQVSCQDNGFPPCYQCIANPTGDLCQATDSLCDDGNDCTVDDCSDDPTIGCVYTNPAFLGDTGFPTECYICEPTENNIDISNGVCDSATGEDCQSDPADCGIVGFPCTAPNSPNPPLQTPEDFDVVPPPNPAITECIAAITLVIPSDLVFDTISCEDGDRCTLNTCTFVAGDYVQDQPGTCSNPPLGCQRISDGCCPAGCEGPGFGVDCPGTVDPVTICDPDCCPPQGCGDSLVEAAETCDNTLPSGEAGLQSDGSPVTDAECRAPATANECTYCGDGIIDSPTEECDGTALGQCDTCTATCTCGLITTGLCLTGSGLIGEGAAPQCSCSLNQSGLMPAGGWHIWAMLGSLVALVSMARMRFEK